MRVRNTAVLAVGAATLIGAAPAQAKPHHGRHSHLSKQERRQNAQIRKANARATQASRQADQAASLARTVQQAVANLTGATATSLGQLASGEQQLAAGVGGLSGVVNDPNTGLGAVNKGLGAVSATVNDPKTGLGAVNGRLNGSEIGVASLQVSQSANGSAPYTNAGTLWAGQIPRDGNNASQTSGSTVIACTNSGGCRLRLQAAIRTNRGAFKGAAGQAGGGIVVTPAAGGPLTAAAQTQPDGKHGTTKTVNIGQVPLTSGTPSDGMGNTVPFGPPGGSVNTDGTISVPSGGSIVQGVVQFFDFDNAGT